MLAVFFFFSEWPSIVSTVTSFQCTSRDTSSEYVIELLFRSRLLWSSCIFKTVTYLNQLLFRNKYFFRTPSCLEQLCLSNNYYFSNHTYFSNTVNALKELRLQNRTLIKTHNFLKLPALPSSYFFRRSIFFSGGSFLLLLFF